MISKWSLAKGMLSTKFSLAKGTVDQLMWRTIVHHIPRWREPSPLRDFMRRLWPFTLWKVDCMHGNWQTRCIWIDGHVVIWEIMRIHWFWGPWNNRQDVVDDFSGCGGRHEMLTRGMWRTTFCRCRKHSRKLPINENSGNFERKLTSIYDR